MSLHPTKSECQDWQGAVNKAGYPFGYLHRKTYTKHVGPIPDGYHVHHKCKNTRCLNPDHLQAISPQDHFLLHFLEERGRGLDLVLEIRERGRQPGASYRDVAKEYGVHYSTVLRWWNAETWSGLLADEPPVVTPPLPCHLPGCDRPASGNRHSRYCSELHRQADRPRRQREQRRAA